MRLAKLVGGRVGRAACVNVRSVQAGINEAVTAGIAERELCIKAGIDELIAENSRDHAAMLLEAYGPVPPVVRMGQGEYRADWMP